MAVSDIADSKGQIIEEPDRLKFQVRFWRQEWLSFESRQFFTTYVHSESSDPLSLSD
jgi:hypothetical protein